MLSCLTRHELATWLQTDYQLSPGDAATVLGTSIEYNIAEAPDRNVGVVAKIRKNSLLVLPTSSLSQLGGYAE
jgi:hypothetical protein